MKRTLIFFLLILFSVNPLLADRTGNELLGECKGVIRAIDTKDYANADLFGSGICFGYVNGSRDAYNTSVETLKFANTYDNEVTKALIPCIPQQVEVGQLARILVKYLESHPEELHEDYKDLTRRAFSEAFPCR